MEKPSGPFVRKRGMFFGYCAEATIRGRRGPRPLSRAFVVSPAAAARS